MGEHLVLCVDRLITTESLQSLEASQTLEAAGHSRGNSSSHINNSVSAIDIKEDEEQETGGEDETLIQKAECRICQDEDSVKNLEKPCACSGSLKFAHRACVQRWCNEKRDITCEICNQPYQPGYTAPPAAYPEDTAIDISGGWTIPGTPLDLHDPRLLAVAAAERHLRDADYDEYADSSASGAAFCRSAALILMALLLLRHALRFGNGDGGEDDMSTFFSLFLLRAAGFLLPCYIMAWAISILQRRRQRQEAEAIAAAEVAFMLRAGQRRGFHVTIAPVAAPPPEPEPATAPASAATTQGPATAAHSDPPH